MLFNTLQNTTNTGIDSLFSSNFGKETDVIFLTCNENWKIYPYWKIKK